MIRRLLSLCTAATLALASFPLPALAKDAPVVDTQAASSSTAVSQEQLEQLPSGRSFADLIAQVPQVSQAKENPVDSFNWNRVSLDGIGTASAIEQTQVLASGSSAVYGSDALGGVVNAILGPQREWPGEAAGLNGTLIATGRSGRDKIAVFYTPDGYDFDWTTERDFRRSPNDALEALDEACELVDYASFGPAPRLDLSQLHLPQAYKLTPDVRLQTGGGQQPASPAATRPRPPITRIPLPGGGEEVKPEVDFSVTGYYRLRGFWIQDRENQRRSAPSAQTTSQAQPQATSSPRSDTDTEFWDMRLMLNPDLKITDNIHVKAQFRILDDFLFGEGVRDSANPLRFNPGNQMTFKQAQQQEDADGGDDFRVERAWAEVKTPIGRLDFGRMASNWGMGLFANDGNRLDWMQDALGDDRGDTVDRVKLVMKFGDLYVVPIMDRVVENAVDDSDDDIHQYLMAILYKTEGPGAGAYDGFREGDAQGTEAYFFDVYGNNKAGTLTLSTEPGYVFGSGDINIRGVTNTTFKDIDVDALCWVTMADANLTDDKDLKVGMRLEWGWALAPEEGDFLARRTDPQAKAGSGTASTPITADPSRRRIRTVGLNSDYDVDYLLFEHYLGNVKNPFSWKLGTSATALEDLGEFTKLIYARAEEDTWLTGRYDQKVAANGQRQSTPVVTRQATSLDYEDDGILFGSFVSPGIEFNPPPKTPKPSQRGTDGSGVAEIATPQLSSYQSEFLGGIEFEVARSVALGVRYVHRSIPRVLEDVSGTSGGSATREGVVDDAAVANEFAKLDPKAQEFFGGFIESASRERLQQDASGLSRRDFLEFGGELGGPIIKDRLWMWGSANRNRVEQGQPAHIFSSNFYLTGLSSSVAGGFSLPPKTAPGFGSDKAFTELWTPENVIILQGGCSAQEKLAALDNLQAVWDGKPVTVAARGIYGVEEVFTIYPEAPAAQGPNDPLYDIGEAAREDARRKHEAATAKKRAPSGGDMSMAAPPEAGPSEMARTGFGESQRKGPAAWDQWGLRAVGFTPPGSPGSAWAIEDGRKPNVVVAVIDSGLDLSHPDGPEHLWTNPGEVPGNGRDDDRNGYVDDVHGWNFVNENADLTDRRGHGTQVAGIIAARRNNGIGIAGINPGARLMALKVGDDQGLANTLRLYRALRYAANHGARVINLSLGKAPRSKLVQLAINYARARGAVVVVAAGNEGGEVSGFSPAGARRALAVGAMGLKGGRMAVSNTGLNLGLMAPGEAIYSLHSKDADWQGPAMERERRYYAPSGTSFAAPIVAGTASLILARQPDLPAVVVEDLLLASAQPLEGEGWQAGQGWGRLDAAKALALDPKTLITIKPEEVVVRRDGKKRVSAVELFGVVRGMFSRYTVELGQGRSPTAWQALAGPSESPVAHGLICAIPAERLKGPREWTIRITAEGPGGARRVAYVPVSL